MAENFGWRVFGVFITIDLAMAGLIFGPSIWVSCCGEQGGVLAGPSLRISPLSGSFVRVLLITLDDEESTGLLRCRAQCIPILGLWVKLGSNPTRPLVMSN